MKAPYPILYEDEFLIAIDKPAGIESTPSKPELESKSVQGKMQWWAKKDNKDFKPYLLHRLDLRTSGVLLLGKFPRDRERLESIFKDKSTSKKYHALIKGVPKKHSGTITIPLDARHSKVKVPAITHYRVVKKMGPVSVVEVRIETGRKHQIRQHFALIGHPLALDSEHGDKKFNGTLKQKFNMRHMFLRAVELRFRHPMLEKELTLKVRNQ